jgi:uncharacterized protein (TIGR00661 family)
MRILYGLSGEGFGHSSRALVVAKYLEEKGHTVKLLTHDQAYAVLKDKFDVFKVKGLALKFEKSVLSETKTFEHNIKHFPQNLKKWRQFHRLMTEFKPDLCISDMEPIVPMLRNWYGLPLICLDNQHRITNLEIDVPTKYYKDYLMAKWVVESFVGKADYFIVTSFAQMPVRKEYQMNTFIVPPMIREQVKSAKTKTKNIILVYLTKKDKSILSALEKIGEKFVVYGYNINKKAGNLQFKTRDYFFKDLCECKAIIATSGFTLISEAIYLKKPYLAVPLKGQFEQTLNALFLKKAGFGEYSEKLDEKQILDFLKNLKSYTRKLTGYKPDYNKLYKVLDFCLNEFE